LFLLFILGGFLVTGLERDATSKTAKRNLSPIITRAIYLDEEDSFFEKED